MEGLPKKVVTPKVEKKLINVKKSDTVILVSDWKEEAIEFIKNFEGFRKCAYPDNKQYSVGFGTKSKPGKCITYEEAIKRKKEHLKPLYELVDNSCYTDNQKIAMTSYMYNVGRYAMNISTYVKRCDHKSVRYIMGIYGWNMKGLIKRRKAELQLFNK